MDIILYLIQSSIRVWRSGEIFPLMTSLYYGEEVIKMETLSPKV